MGGYTATIQKTKTLRRTYCKIPANNLWRFLATATVRKVRPARAAGPDGPMRREEGRETARGDGRREGLQRSGEGRAAGEAVGKRSDACAAKRARGARTQAAIM